MGGLTANRTRALGLSNVHIRTEQPSATIAVTGEMLELKYPRPDLAGGGGERGQIVGFSRRSASRMRKMLASCDQNKLITEGIFITLTYPNVFPLDPKTWKINLAAFCRKLFHFCKRVAVIWKLELQERGAPHFHLLAVGCPWIPWQWVAAHWNRIVAPGDLDHLSAGTECRAAKNKLQLRSYLSKYLAKGCDQ